MTGPAAGRPPVLLAVAHGTRSAAGQAQIRDLVDRVACRRPDLDVRLAYVDVQQPRVGEAIRGLDAVVVPLLLSAGYHVRVDIAEAVAANNAVAAAPLGPDPVLTESLRRRIQGADAVVLAAAGSSDPAWRADIAAVAARLDAHVAYATGAELRVPDVVARLREQGARRITIAAYLLAEGLFYRSLHAAGADEVTPPLCADPAVVDLVLTRYHDLTMAPSGL
ncbi:sirohydrochlorin chelatase [Actinoplanes sp. NPDC049599]|uniref:sirohydrochlorin chelatase n=1 Tax=Actinoplanes sp. NPDC049599 TaxID=3363903 RepID=UPI00379824D5